MAADDKKRFYWLKLKEDFFKNYKIKALKALPNGRFYALIYLELLAESTSHEGQLRFSKTLPYDHITLAAVIDEDPDIVKSAIDAFVRLELAEILEDQTIYMREIKKLIGSETGQTIRKREAKNQKGISYPDNTPLIGTSGGKDTQEYRDKSIEIRDKSIDTSICNEYISEFDDDDNKARTREIIKSRWMEAGYTKEDVERVFNYMKDIDFTESNFKKIMLVLKERAVIDVDAYLVTMKKNGSLTAGEGDDHYEYCE